MKNSLKQFIWALSMLLMIPFSGCGDASNQEEASQDIAQSENAGQASDTDAPFVPFALDSSKVVKLPSGLKYYMETEGTGNQVKAGDKVLVHYHGMLTDGTVFDSSFERNQPVELSLQQVILGWQEGLPLCKVGARIVLIIPPDLGYGSSPQNKIPANSTLIFNIEVLGVNS